MILLGSAVSTSKSVFLSWSKKQSLCDEQGQPFPAPHMEPCCSISCFSTAARRALFRRVHPRLASSIILTHPTPYTPWTGMPIPYLAQRECPLKPWTGTETFEICCKFLVLLQTFADFSRMNLLLFLQIFFFKRTKTYSTNYSCILPRGGGVVTFFSPI